MSSGGHGGSPLPFYDALTAYSEKIRGNSGAVLSDWPLAITGLTFLFIALVFAPGVVSRAFSFSLFLSPLWLPYVLVGATIKQYRILKRAEFIDSFEYILLEIIPPRSITKTPIAMETVLAGLWLNPGEANWYSYNFKGGVRPWWSLEIASIEGRLHFYIWTRSTFRRQIESQLYAQYPGAQLVEVEDYTKLISEHGGEWEVWGCDFIKANPDPYPIKTYVDYGLDKVSKEEEQTDPISNVLEFMGNIGKGECMWLQIMIRTTKASDKYPGQKNTSGKQFTWKDHAAAEIDTIRKRAVTKSKFLDPTTGKMIETEGFPNPTKGDSEKIAAIERNVSKLAFDTGIRFIYLGKPDKFQSTTISGIKALFYAFSSENYNSLSWSHWMLSFSDYPWEINVESRKAHMRHLMMDAYRRRSWFYHPHETPPFTMSIEELASIYHIPSAAVTTPTLGRIQSATSEAPPGLPI